MQDSVSDTPRSSSPLGGQRTGLVFSAGWRLIGTVARVLVAFLAVPLYVRALGMSQWGLLALFLAAVAPLALLDTGFGTATIKYVAEAVGRGDRAGAVSVVHTTLWVNAAIGLAGTILLMALAPGLAGSVFAIPVEHVERATLGFRLVAPLWFVNIAVSPFVATLAAHQRFDRIAFIGTVSSVLSSTLGVAAALIWRSVVHVLVALIAAAVATGLLYRQAAGVVMEGTGGWPVWNPHAFRRSARYAGWQLIAVAGITLSGFSDRYVLGIYFAPAVVGFYAVAFMLYSQVQGAFTEMGEVILPAVSHRQGGACLPEARRLTLLAGWALTSAYGVCAAVLATVGGDFLQLWVSAGVAQAATSTLRTLCAAGIVSMASFVPLQYVLGIGEARWNALATSLVGVIVLGGSMVLIPRLGLVGAGYSLLVAVLLQWLLLPVIRQRHFATASSLTSFVADVWAPPVTSLALLVGLVELHDHLARPPSWPWLIAETAVGLLVGAAIQFAVSECIPGGSRRRRDVVASLKPVLSALRTPRSG